MSPQPNASSRHWLRYLRLYRFHNRLKGFRLTDREFGKHLTVDFNTRFRETIDEARIGKSVFTHRRVEPLDPQSAKNPLLGAAVPRRILHRTVDRRLRRPDRILAA